MTGTRRGHTKATRHDWIDAALNALADVPIDKLRVLPLAATLDVSRSSFYWYFEDFAELHAELMALWERNTTSIVERSERGAATIVAACLGVFECWADRGLYDAQLDLAVRDWGRRDDAIATRVSQADAVRLTAVSNMFMRHGFDPEESLVRARLLYHSQVGYFAVGTVEPVSVRVAYLPYYLQAMAGRGPTDEELEDFRAFLAERADPDR